MKEESNTFTVAASSLDYSNLAVLNGSSAIGYIDEIPLEKVNGVIDKFEEEANARKKDIEKETSERIKDIEDLKFFTELSKDAICDSFNYNMKMIKKEVKEIKNQLFICMSIFGSLIFFLFFGFIYCMMFK